MKKIFALVALAASVISVNAKTLWTGNCTFADYKVASGDRPIFTPEDFNDVAVGDKIIFSITNNNDDPQSWHQVEIWQWDGEQPAPDALTNPGVHILDGMTSAEFTIDETLLEGLRGGMSCAAGTGYTVRNIEVTSFDGVVWEGVCNCPNWVPDPAVTLPGSNFAKAQEGDVLVFTLEVITPGDWAAIQIDKASTFSAGPFGTVELAANQTEVKIPLTAELLASLVTDGINITGANFRLFKIEIVSGDDLPPVDNDAIWSGELVQDSWTPNLTVPASKFALVQAGDILVFTVTAGDENSSISLKSNLPEGWGEMPSDAGEYGNYIYITDGPGEYYFPINAEAAALLKEYGMTVTGSYYTLAKIELQAAPVEETALWTGTMKAGDWQNQLTLEASKFADVEAGSVLAFTVSEVEGDGQISLKSNLPEGWGELPSDGGEFGNYIHVSDGPGVYYFEVNEAAAAIMKEYGIVVAGLGYTITKIALVDNNGDGVAAINGETAVDGPVFNLNGVKVADSLKDVTNPGLYICGGKKLIVK